MKILPHHVYRSFEGKTYTEFWGRNQHEFWNKKKWQQNAPFASDLQKCSRGGPRTLTCKRGIFFPHPLPSGASRRFRYPQAVDLLEFTWSDLNHMYSIARRSHGSVSVHSLLQMLRMGESLYLGYLRSIFNKNNKTEYLSFIIYFVLEFVTILFILLFLFYSYFIDIVFLSSLYSKTELQNDPIWLYHYFQIRARYVSCIGYALRTVSQEPQCARFSRVFTCPPTV